MRVLTAYMFCTNGGVETALKNRIKNISSDQVEIDLLFLEDYGGQSLFDGLNCNVYIESNLEAIKKIISQGCYDIVISIDTPIILDLLYKMNYRGTIGLEVHTTYANSLQYLKSLKPNLVSFIVVPSLYQKKLINEFIALDIDIYVLPNSIDTNFFKPVPTPVVGSRPIIAWVGRIDKHKNWNLYLDVAKAITEQEQGKVEFWLIGGMKSEPTQIEAFHDKIRAYGLSNNFRWLPYVPYSCMPSAYSYIAQSGGCYITTSSNESFGMTVIEAMACGCPVVANSVGALIELLEDAKYGLLIDMKRETITSVSDNILAFINNKARRRKTTFEANKYVVSSFNELVVQKKYIEILKGVLCEL